MGKRVDVVVFNGIKFRRYPDAKWACDRSYYVPGITDRQRGFGRLHEEIWKSAHGEIPDGCHIHHADGDALNNDIANLVCLDADEHRALHVEDRHASGVYRTDARLAHLAAIRPEAAKWHRSDEGRAWHREHGRATWVDRQPAEATCEQCGARYNTLAAQRHDRFCSNACKSAWRRATGVDDEERACPQCGGVFRVNRYSKQRFCGRSCSARYGHASRAGRVESDGR